MVNTLSAPAVQSVNDRETGEVWLTMIQLTQGAWKQNLVADHVSHVHDGEVYEPFAFVIKLPDENEQGVPVLSWEADNVDRRLVSVFRQVTGKVDASIFWVLASSPDVIERGPMELELHAASYNAMTISGTLSVEPILDRQAGYKTMTPGTTPGLF